MPIYEYRCKKGHTFEVLQRFSDDPVASCEVCGIPVQRVFHPVAVHFKGSGFYNTDYGTRKRLREKEASEGSKDSKDTKQSKDTAKDAKSTDKPSASDKTSEPKAAAA
jgi:putative FmdB family regulatory protein